MDLAAHANAEGHAWPSVATLADHAGCSERTVQRALAKLVQLGRLAVSKVAGIALGTSCVTTVELVGAPLRA
ncbi:helix-turn-helix domain-containing protein [Micromonospora costi]|uniref:helix-turn-helix domain-containing protein n=1 Tax=Micromonospora costi TaxID=1530042 RepID=UPI0033F7B5B4